MKKLLLSLIPLLLIGCHVETGATPATPDKAPLAGTTRAANPSNKTTEVIPEKPSTQISKLKHKDRFYQIDDLPVVKIKANGHTIDAWVMSTEAQRTEGMMFLKDADVKENQGMLFVFPEEQEKGRGFWMQNTYIPLDIIYVMKDRRVGNIVQGKVLDETNLPSSTPFLYVIELKKGTAKKLGIKPGTLIEMPGSLKAS